MTDHELIEFAAKAAGIDVHYSDNWGDFSVGEPYSRDECRWNPLTDDGDALRLAAKLDIETGRALGNDWWAKHYASPNVFRESIERPDGSQDPSAAIRRAIVRAAANIGGNTNLST
ncbi:hypothetical protein [Chromobacterium haemolyticum]|uniref:hypothetical protein n=1 Tax=Chromobacterium haemolyticum TaxID=394935 RepID=UPI00058514C6|nr:hypothetical protein [Chromobacterium haemolyticum]